MVEMKKVYYSLVRFLTSHNKIGLFLSAAMFLTGCIACFYSSLLFLVAVYFLFSLAASFRIITYKTGKISLFMIDKTWQHYRMKYNEEESRARYKEMSIKRAAIYFLISLSVFFVWIICELACL